MSRLVPTSTPGIILFGGFLVGTIDILKNIVFVAMGGRSAVWLFQYVAQGALGKAAFEGGYRTAAAGAFFHYLIAYTVFTLFYLASGRLETLWRHPYLWGPLYGIAVWCTMEFLILPLSAIGPRSHPMNVAVDGLLTHMLCVGLPTAIIASAARSGRS